MKIHLAAGLALAALMASCTGGRDYESADGDPMQTRIYTLANGLKVYLSVNPAEPRIQTYIAVRTGSKHDPAETTGGASYVQGYPSIRHHKSRSRSTVAR